jgi:hypothetical protein
LIERLPQEEVVGHGPGLVPETFIEFGVIDVDNHSSWPRQVTPSTSPFALDYQNLDIRRWTMRRLARTVLLLLTAAAMLTACSFLDRSGNPLDKLRDAIADEVDDPARAETMLASLERTDQLMLQSAKVLADGAEAQLRLFLDYDSTPEDFEALFESVSSARRELQRELLDEHIRFKQTATADEWGALVGIHTRAVNARAEALTRSALSAAKS